MYLAANGTSISVFDNATSVELSCDMAGFIPADSALNWYMNNELVSLNERVTVSFSSGSNQSSRGYNMPNSSSLSILTFTPPETTDSGLYECRITGYEFLPEQSIQLSVQAGSQDTAVTTVTSRYLKLIQHSDPH